MPIVEIPLTIDATVAIDSSKTNHGTANFLTVETGDAARRIFAHGTRSFPLGARIVSAELQATQQAVATSASRTLVARPVTASWKESTLTWGNQPGTNADASVTVTVTGAGTVGRVVSWDVTAMTQAVADGTPWYGFRIHSQSEARIRFWSRESPQGGLKWVVNYTTTPAAPSRLSPAAGRAVSLERPTLTFSPDDLRDGDMTAYRVQLFDGNTPEVTPAPPMDERFATFNINGITSAPVPFMTRLADLAGTIVDSGAKIVGLQEVSRDQVDQPALLTDAVKALTHPDWTMFVGPNLNAILMDTTVFEPQWPITADKGLGDGKWASAMLVKHIASGALFIFWTTHYLTSGYLTEQIKHTRVLTPWLASLSAANNAPLVGSGDFNAKDKSANRPMGMLQLAGHLDVRDLVEPEDIVNRDWNSLDKYPPETNPMQGYWIDHLMVSGGPTPTLVGLFDSGTSSDHNLVYADVSYSPASVVVTDLGEPSFDTGEVASTVPQYLMEQDVADEQIVWWRVRVKGQTEWSDWSEPTFFVRRVKPIVSIVSPGEAPSDYVTETTPPFIWTSDATEQTAYRVLVTDPEDHTQILWDSLRQGGQSESTTPQQPLGLTVTGLYRVEVRVEDEYVREATPNDPIYASAERLFRFELVTGIEPVTLLDAHQVDDRPWMSLTWRDATAADAYEILRDGVSIAIVDSVDVLDAGTDYEWIDRKVDPQTPHEWEVRRIVNGETSPGKTIAGQIFVTGTWLCSLDGEHAFVVAGADDGGPVTWSVDENVELFRPLGGSVTHPVTHAIFGRQGDLQGSVVAWGEQSLDDARAAIDAMRPPVAPYGTRMILTEVDQAVTVFWVGVATDRRHEFGDWFGIVAELHEVPDGVA